MTPPVPRPAGGAILWSRIDDDLSVATREGDFAGYVDRRSAAEFFLFDHHSRHVGIYVDEANARAALGTTPDPILRASLALSGARFLRALTAGLTPPT